MTWPSKHSASQRTRSSERSQSPGWKSENGSGRVAVRGHVVGLDRRHLAMRFVRQEVLAVRLDQFRMPLNDQQILRVLVLGLVGEVVAAGDERALVDDDDLVMSNGVAGVDQRRQSRHC